MPKQVVYINGIDVSGLLHEHVVNLIRQSRDSGSGELTLTVRPNALYNALAGNDEMSEEEPPYRYRILLKIYMNVLYKQCIIISIIYVNYTRGNQTEYLSVYTYRSTILIKICTALCINGTVSKPFKVIQNTHYSS